MAAKKLRWSYYYPALIKYNSTNTLYRPYAYFNTYHTLYILLFKKLFWANFSSLTYKNQGLIYNNITLSYYYATINNINYFSLGSSKVNLLPHCTVEVLPYTTLSLPFFKTTFNSLIYISYILLSGYYISNPIWFKLVHTYTWVSNLFLFDNSVNTFYFKLYRY